MGKWVKFLRSLESSGGSIIILILLIIIFAIFSKLGFKDVESQIYFILGALVGIIKSHEDKEQPHANNDTKETPDTTKP